MIVAWRCRDCAELTLRKLSGCYHCGSRNLKEQWSPSKGEEELEVALLEVADEPLG